MDLEGEWDPEAHDQQMAALYGDDADYDEDGKPTWDDDINIGDIAMANDSESTRQKKKKKKKGEKAVEEDGVSVDAMDADIDKVDDNEWDGTEEMRKRKIEEYMDEVYGLDFNDMVRAPVELPYLVINISISRSAESPQGSSIHTSNQKTSTFRQQKF